MVLASACSFLARRLVQLPALLCCEAMVWAVTFLAFPLRLLTAVDGERKLRGLIGEMQAQMDRLVWENRDLKDRLHGAARELQVMEAVLDEMEEEQEDASARIHVLHTQLKVLSQENMRLNEHKGKSMWDTEPPMAAHHDDEGKPDTRAATSLPSPWEKEEEPAAAEKAALAQQQAAKLVARRRSLFSLGMSVAVGAVVWSADAPCLPLLAGLFAVVGVSMRSVSRSCDELRRGGPAADAVALLGLNWFLLGVLVSPMLPGVARAVVPRAGRVLGPALTWLAAAAPL